MQPSDCEELKCLISQDKLNELELIGFINKQKYKRYKAVIFVDLDGTLIPDDVEDTQAKVDSELIRYLHRLDKQKNILVVPNTGRSSGAVFFLLKDLNFPGGLGIASNGHEFL